MRRVVLLSLAILLFAGGSSVAQERKEEQKEEEKKFYNLTKELVLRYRSGEFGEAIVTAEKLIQLLKEQQKRIEGAEQIIPETDTTKDKQGLHVLMKCNRKARREPEPWAEVVGEVNQWDVLETIGNEGGYYKIRLRSGITGYVNELWVEKVGTKEELEKIAQRRILILKTERNPVWVKAWVANVRSRPSRNNQVIRKFKVGDRLFSQNETKESWLRVKWRNSLDVKSENDYSEGWIHKSLVSSEALTDGGIRRITFVNTRQLSPEMKRSILEGKIRLGMTKEMVIASWGYPKDIKRTVTRWGVSEQWIYGDFGPYLYFENEKLTSWQD